MKKSRVNIKVLESQILAMRAEGQVSFINTLFFQKSFDLQAAVLPCIINEIKKICGQLLKQVI